MKKYLLAAVLLLGIGQAYAQTNRPINYVPSTTFQSTINNLFAPLSTTQITSGILMDKSITLTKPDTFDGTNTCGIATTNNWYQLLGQTRAARIGNTPNIMPDSSLIEQVVLQNSHDRVSLGILFADYHKIKPANTATEGWFTFSNNQLYDVSNRTENPYEQKLLVATAPLRLNNADGEVKFIIPSALVFSNKGSFTVEADWGKGLGYQTISLDTEYPVSYTTTGVKNITLKITHAGISFYAKTTIAIEQVYTINNALGKNCQGVCFDALWSDIDQTTAQPITTAEGYIIYANGRSYLQKPVIFIEGQDVLDEYNFKDLFYVLTERDPDNPNVPLNKLISNGYDVIILNFKRTGGQSMRNNAEVLRRLIKWVNQQKQGNEKLVVAGMSMGGVIARYTLAKMENVYCENHNVGKYVSYDAPHLGANVPLGMQVITFLANNRTLGLSYDIAVRAWQLSRTSTRELLSIHAISDGAPTAQHISFYDELNNLGMPQQCRNIAFSNGNTFNSIPSTTGISYNEGDEILNYVKIPDPAESSKLTINLNIFAVNSLALQTVTYARIIYELDLDFPWYVNIFIPDIHTGKILLVDENYQYLSQKPFDNAPGAYINTQKSIANAVNGMSTNDRDNHCIVPTLSAFGIDNAALFYNQNYQNIQTSGVSPFDEIYSSDNGINFSHLILAPNFANQFYNLLGSVNTSDKSFLDLNETFNMTQQSYVRKLPKELNINNNGELQINTSLGCNYGNGIVSPAGSTFITSAFECGTNIHVNSGGKIKIGDGSRYGIVQLPVGSQITVHSGGTLNIAWGSKLVLAGGKLIFEEGAGIALAENGIIEIEEGGKIEVKENATFTWSGTGFIKVNTPSVGVANIIGTGSNAKFYKKGTGALYSQKLIEVVGGGSLSVDKSLAEFKIELGKVVLDNNCFVDVEAKMICHGIKFTTPSAGVKHKGVMVYGQQNTPYLSSSTIENAQWGFMCYNNSGTATKASLLNCKFINNDLGAYINGKGADISNCTFWHNKYGAIHLDMMTFTSKLNYVNIYNNNNYPILATGTNYGLVSITNSAIYNNNSTGVYASYTTVGAGCSNISNNFDASQFTGRNILMAQQSVLAQEPALWPNVGNNYFFNSIGDGIITNEVKRMYFNKGNNHFQVNNGWEIYGTMPKQAGTKPAYPAVKADQNYWDLAGNAAVNRLQYWVKYEYPTSGTWRDLMITDNTPLASAPTFSACGSGGVGNLPGTGIDNVASVLIGKPTFLLSDNRDIKDVFNQGLYDLYVDNNVLSALNNFSAIANHNYSMTNNIMHCGRLTNEYAIWFEVVYASYHKMLECLNTGISGGTIGSYLLTPSVYDLIDNTQQNLLTRTNNAGDYDYEIAVGLNLDNAILYKLEDKLDECKQKLITLKDNEPHTTNNENLIVYTLCNIEKELQYKNNEITKVNLRDMLAGCQLALSLPKANDEPNGGTEPSDPSYTELLSKNGTSQPNAFASIQKQSKKEVDAITVYPNPTKGVLNIYSSYNKVIKVKVWDMSGKLILEENDTTQINLSTTGVYLIAITTEKSTYTRKVVVE